MTLSEIRLTITREDAAPEVRTVTPGVYVIGRGAEADMRIETPLLSRAHARLTVTDREAIIEDLGSRNGTTINGRPLSSATVLRAREVVELGPVKFEFLRVPLAMSPEMSIASKREALGKLLPPEFLHGGKYELGRVVAQGGMGAILDAKEATIDRRVAMKVMLDGGSPADLLRFISEAKVTGQLEHPNIVPVHELGVDAKEQVFYTMKFVRGITLKKVLDLLAEGQPGTVEKYPLGQLLTVFQKVCDAIAFAHSKQVIHRDLKPENIMIGDFGEVLVMDWGLAKVLDPTRGAEGARSLIRTGVRQELADAETQSGHVMGTPQYMAPEQAHGSHDTLDARTDVYALGAILYHILTLRPSIEGDDAQEVLHKAARGEFVPPTDATAGKKRLPHLPGGRVPAALSAVTMKAMALHLRLRYAAVPEFQAEIEAYQNGFATSVERGNLGTQTSLLFKRHRMLAAAAALFLIVAVGLTAALVASERRGAQAIARLRSSAPAFYEQARASLDRGRVKDAIEQIGSALEFEPATPDYVRLRADALEADQQWAPAAEAYRRVLALRADDAGARDNLALCEKVLTAGPAVTKAHYLELAALAERERRHEATVFRALAAAAK